MKYQNPLVRGFYPDPSVCKANGLYYMVCSSMQYFPGVPLFESSDLVNWKQIGHCLTRPSQIELSKVNSSGGVFAPCIRYEEGRFYMTTTNDTTHENFYVWTDNIYSEWSDPISVDQGGIDPSFYFEDGHAYFMSNGTDDLGNPGILQCEIDIHTGKKLSPSINIWQGSGGRYLEGPHLYRLGRFYYLLAAEGGTEYGHMVTYARGESIYGPFESYPYNPVLTNRNLGGYEIQGVGHGDLIEGPDGSFWILHLGFRQSGQWSTYHHLGREVFLASVNFGDDGWFRAGINGTTTLEIEVPHTTLSQEFKTSYTFENTSWKLDWSYLRIPKADHYITSKNRLILFGTDISLQEADSPTFIGLRQKEFNMKLSATLLLDQGEAGITVYMDENHHYDFFLRKNHLEYQVVCRICIGNIQSEEGIFSMGGINQVTLAIESNSQHYHFYVVTGENHHLLATGLSRYLSSEVAGGFTGVLLGLYAYGMESMNQAEFTNFQCDYI